MEIKRKFMKNNKKIIFSIVLNKIDLNNITFVFDITTPVLTLMTI